MTRLAEIRARLDAATPGPWMWTHDAHNARIKAANKASGRRHRPREEWVRLLKGPDPDFSDGIMSQAWDDAYARQVLGIAWWQIKGQTFCGGPNAPDAALIANAPVDLAWLLGEVERLRTALDDISDGCQCTHPDPWAIGQCNCQTDTARAALDPPADPDLSTC